MIPLYEDNHLLILNKPAGLLTQPSGTDQDSLESQAKLWLKDVYQKPGNVFLHAVHRLDKPVSGIVIFCKTSKALTRLNASMRARQMKKVYWAWVEGKLPAKAGFLEHFLIHADFCAQVGSKSHPKAKSARLSYQQLISENGQSLVEIELETGRYHQIRAQMSAAGCPIWGDYKYGSRHPFEIDTIALHHRFLTFPHPITQTLLVIEAPLPAPWPIIQ